MEKGICHICGEFKDLTFEHLPPKKACNNSRAKIYSGDEVMKQVTGTIKPWEYKDMQYTYEQKGIGIHSLCEECNNITGKWYANEYIKISNSILEYISDKDINNIIGLKLNFKEIYPLRFVKQVVSMFASTFPEETIKDNPELMNFILKRDNKSLDTSKYRISMYILKTKKVAWSGINVIGNIRMSEMKTVASLELYPLGFEFEFEPHGKSENLDIMSFANDFEYNDKVNMNMVIPARERNTPFPCDYRTKEEIDKQRVKSIEEHINLLCNDIINNTNKKDVAVLVNKYRNNEITSAEFTIEMHKLKSK